MMVVVVLDKLKQAMNVQPTLLKTQAYALIYVEMVLTCMAVTLMNTVMMTTLLPTMAVTTHAK